MKFQNTFCSQCGGEFGPGDNGYSHCRNHHPRAQQIAALKAQKQKVVADYQKLVTDINSQISKLQALEYTA